MKSGAKNSKEKEGGFGEGGWILKKKEGGGCLVGFFLGGWGEGFLGGVGGVVCGGVVLFP